MSERKGTKALELWCKRLIKDCPDVKIENMTTSWRNGMAFCALVHHFRPDLIDMSTLKPENIYENNQLAFNIAEKHLGIPALLDPEDMVENDVPDRLSILTYLSQFYQRLGHTVNTKASENESKSSSGASPTGTDAMLKFGKSGLDKCAACGLPVYLAQRLIVSHKLYHRRCFRCSKCLGHMNPKNFDSSNGSDFTCDSCKNENQLSKYLNNNDQMGMLAFSDELKSSNNELKDTTVSKPKRPQSIIDKINMFENKLDKNTPSLSHKYGSISLNNTLLDSDKTDSSPNMTNTPETKNEKTDCVESKLDLKNVSLGETELTFSKPEQKVYKSDISKLSFLQTQLINDSLEAMKDLDTISRCHLSDNENLTKDIETKLKINEDDFMPEKTNEETNITDDKRLAQSNPIPKPEELLIENKSTDNTEISINVPPRRKKHLSPKTKSSESQPGRHSLTVKNDDPLHYPDSLNPFSDDEGDNNDDTQHKKVEDSSKRVSTNPFGSSDEEDDEVPPIQPPQSFANPTPTRRHITAYNPFWSDGEEPSSDEDNDKERSPLMKSPLTTSTPNLPSGGARRRKARAPPPPPPAAPPPALVLPDSSLSHASMDDVRSISSVSSYNSSLHYDQQKSTGKLTPVMRHKRPAPTPPPDNLSTSALSIEKDMDSLETRYSLSSRKTKGPAPGLPLPERREVKLQITSEELQIQLDMLETQQLGLERQGVLIEQMIRDKCEGDEPVDVPQEEIEDLVIQLCELVNEKNDLFRRQTELMYIRRQQRLEQEQADIEHEIRVLQSRPAVNRIDADKVREEQLVSRLVEIVRLRDELVQQVDAERRRERQEDLAIAASIATKRAQRNSESNSSSIKSTEAVATPKKNKVKDKVKKQLKKAKHTLIPKKKEDGDRKEEKSEKVKKSK